MADDSLKFIMANDSVKSDKKDKNKFQKIDYGKVDPILKTNPDITLLEFRKQCDETISGWSFYNRRKFIKTGRQFGEIKSTIPFVQNKTAVEYIIEKCAPKKSPLLKDYKNVAAILIKDITTTHSFLKQQGLVKMSDVTFYQFRKKIKILLEGDKTKKTLISSTVPAQRKRKTMYTLLYEKDLTNKKMSIESRELLTGFLEELNKRKNMDLEIIEIISPRHVLEVRSY